MPFNFKNANIAIRENRLGSITGFVGDLETLVKKSEDGSLRNRERCFSQSSSCLSGCATPISAIQKDSIRYFSLKIQPFGRFSDFAQSISYLSCHRNGMNSPSCFSQSASQ